MVLGDNGRHHSVTLGGDGSPIVSHTVKNEVLHRCPSGSPLNVILKHLNKGTRNHHSVTHGPAPEMKNRDGHSFAYVLHYLITGDLIYPLHEGFHRVDALLKELTSLGLADDVMRYATQDSSGRSKSKSAKRRATVFTLPRQASASASASSGVAGGRSAERKASGTLPKRADSSLAKYQSVQSLHVVADRSLSMSYEPDSGGPAVGVQHSSSLSNLDAENEVEFREHLNKSQLTLARCSRSSSGGHRFLSAVKRYLSIKSGGDSQREPAVCSSAKRAPSSLSVSTSAESGSVWRPNHAATAGGGGGVFRPNSARGATLVLLAAADGVAVYGQRAILESLFAEYHVTSLRSFSSAFIDSKVVYQTDEQHSGSGFDIYDGYSSSSYNSNTSSLPKRSNSSEGSYYGGGGSSGSASGSSTSSQCELLTSLYHQRIKPAGFTVTVQSNWRDKHTLEVYHQWLLHRKNNSKSNMGRRLSHPNVLTALSSSPSAGTATGATGVTNPVTRRASVIQRFFNKSALTLHMSTDV